MLLSSFQARLAQDSPQILEKHLKFFHPKLDNRVLVNSIRCNQPVRKNAKHRDSSKNVQDLGERNTFKETLETFESKKWLVENPVVVIYIRKCFHSFPY